MGEWGISGSSPCPVFAPRPHRRRRLRGCSPPVRRQAYRPEPARAVNVSASSRRVTNTRLHRPYEASTSRLKARRPATSTRCFKDGDYVKKGHSCYQIDDAPYARGEDAKAASSGRVGPGQGHRGPVARPPDELGSTSRLRSMNRFVPETAGPATSPQQGHAGEPGAEASASASSVAIDGIVSRTRYGGH